MEKEKEKERGEEHTAGATPSVALNEDQDAVAAAAVTVAVTAGDKSTGREPPSNASYLEWHLQEEVLSWLIGQLSPITDSSHGLQIRSLKEFIEIG
jgi:hypothetical protein